MDLFPVLNPLDIHSRPPGCVSCEYSSTSTGFCPDWVPDGFKVGFLLEAAGGTEIEMKSPLTGGTGRWFFYLVESLGHFRSECGLFETIRCHPPSNNYPVGRQRRAAESHCRQYDNVGGTAMREGGLLSYDADCLVFCIHPAAVLRSNNMSPLLGHKLGREFGGAIAKAFRLYEAGRKPLVLLGDKAKELVAPDFQEGITKWAGHIEDLKPGELRRRLLAVDKRDHLGKWWEEVRS